MMSKRETPLEFAFQYETRVLVEVGVLEAICHERHAYNNNIRVPLWPFLSQGQVVLYVRRSTLPVVDIPQSSNRPDDGWFNSQRRCRINMSTKPQRRSRSHSGDYTATWSLKPRRYTHSDGVAIQCGVHSQRQSRTHEP